MMSKHLENVTAVTIDGHAMHFGRPVTVWAALTAHYGTKAKGSVGKVGNARPSR